MMIPDRKMGLSSASMLWWKHLHPKDTSPPSTMPWASAPLFLTATLVSTNLT
jgi:hypothetical protein